MTIYARASKLDKLTNDKREAAEDLVLGGLRHWVGALLAPRGSDCVWHHGTRLQSIFCRLGGREAARAFDQFCGLLARNARGFVAINNPGAGALTADEARLIAFLSALQNGHTEEAHGILAMFLRPEHHGAALGHSWDFVQALTRAGQTLPYPVQRPGAVAADARSAGCPGGVTIH